MKEHTQKLIEALREELEQYGEMLALLDRQQELVAQRDAAELLKNLAAINAQGAVLQVARKERTQRQSILAGELALPAEATFVDLLRKLPEAYQPLVKALVEENNQCLMRVQQRARQNHLLLSRSLELMQRFVSVLFPANGATTYNHNGQVAQPGLPVRPICEAVG